MDHDLKRLRAIFDEVIQLPPEARSERLAALCGGDTALSQRIEALIAMAESDDPFLADPTREKQAPLDASTLLNTPLSETPGATIGPYKLLQLIGEGGFGSVFMAEQREPVARKVALKIIKLGMDTKQVIARFEQERQALALMDHPNIARVFDAGVTQGVADKDGLIVGGGRPFFVMEYVKGDPITKFADAHRITLRERLELFMQVCQAIQHAHQKGVIHRDLKPSNILVSMVDGRPFAKVIDFGIAKATGARLTEKTLFTEHRQLIGTPEYMSPEQAEGSPDIDTRTDVYALGVLLYELLTGATPFDAERLRSAAFGELQRIIKEEEPPKPSLRLERRLAQPPLPLGQNRSEDDASHTGSESAKTRIKTATHGARTYELKGELDWIVMKSLEKDRARRYEGPSALAADVQRHLAGEPVVAAPPSAGYRLRKFVRKNRGKVIAGSAVAAALLIGIVGFSIAWSRSEREASINANALSIATRALGEMADPNVIDKMLEFGIALDAPSGSIELVPAESIGINSNSDNDPFAVRVVRLLAQGAVDARQREKSRTWELEATNSLLLEQVRRSELAEATIIVKAFEHRDAGGADEEYLATLDPQKAIDARIRYYGPSHAETIRAEIVAASQNWNSDEWLQKNIEWNQRRIHAGEPIQAIDIQVWENLIGGYWRNRDFANCLSYIHRYADHLKDVWASDSRRMSTILVPWRMMKIEAHDTTVNECVAALHTYTTASLHRILASTWWNKEVPLETRLIALDQAEAWDKEHGMDTHPASLAVRAGLCAEDRDNLDAWVQATQYLNQAKAMMETPPWADNLEAQARIADAEQWIHIKPTAEERIADAGELFRRVIREEGTVDERIKWLEQVVNEYTVLIGRDFLITAEALHHLGQYNAFVKFNAVGLEQLQEAIDIRRRNIDAPDATLLLWETFLLSANAQFVDVDAVRASMHRIGHMLPGVYERSNGAIRMYSTSHFPFYWDFSGEMTQKSIEESARDFLAWDDAAIVNALVKGAASVWIPTQSTTTEELNALKFRLDRLLALAPEQYETHLKLGATEFRLSQFEQSLTCFTKVAELLGKKGDDLGPYAHGYTAMTLFKLGRTSEARASLAKMEQLLMKPEALFHDDTDCKALFGEAKALIEDVKE